MPVCEHLPHSAKIADKMAIVRSMHHPMRNHNAAAVEALCGRTPLKGDLELLANDPLTDFPCFGSALSHVLPEHQTVPTYIALPHIMYNVVMLPGQTAGFLGSRHEPLRILRDPNAADFHVPELELPAGLSLADLEHRESLLYLVNAQSIAAERGRHRPRSTLTTNGPSPSCTVPRCAAASIWDKSPRKRATATAATRTAKACCSRSVWSRRAFVSSASTTK